MIAGFAAASVVLTLAGGPAGQPTAGAPLDDRPRRRGSGVAMLWTGGVLTGLGAVGRIAIEGFWVDRADLDADEPFGRWSIPHIAFFTSFQNVLVAPGLPLLGVGALRFGRYRVRAGRLVRSDRRVRRNTVVGATLLGTGLGLWAVTRAVAIPVLRACETNGCAYGYLESTYWISLATAVPGAVLLGLGRGEARPGGRATTATIGPLAVPRGHGLAVTGRF